MEIHSHEFISRRMGYIDNIDGNSILYSIRIKSHSMPPVFDGRCIIRPHFQSSIFLHKEEAALVH